MTTYIKNGKRYNTKTAEKVLERSAREHRGDFRWFEETLYRTPKGAWFLVGEGGPMTKYANHYGNTSSHGDGFEVISDDAALALLESEDDTPSIEKYFHDQLEDA